MDPILLVFLLAPLAVEPPALRYSVSLGDDRVPSVAIAGPGRDLFVAGETNRDAFLCRLAEDGQIIWCRTIGGANAESVTALSFDPASGSLYLAGTTASEDFPTLHPLIATPNFTPRITSRAFLARFSLEDGKLQYSTYYYNLGTASIAAIRFDPQGNTVLAGTTAALPSAFATETSGFLAKLSPVGDQLLFHTEIAGRRVSCMGGSACLPAVPHTGILTIDIRADGWIALGGYSNTWEGLATSDAIQTTCGCEWRDPAGWVGILAPEGKLHYATYLRQEVPGHDESIVSVAFDKEGSLITVGTTGGRDFPTTDGAFLNLPNPECPDCFSRSPVSFYTRIDSTTHQITASTLFGSPAARVKAMLQDPADQGVWLVGYMDSYVALLSFDATKQLGSWRLPAWSGFGFATAVPNGFAIIASNQVSLLDLNARLAGESGTRVFGIANAVSGAWARGSVPGEVVEVYGSAFSDGTRLFFDGILAPRMEVKANRLRAIVPFGIWPTGKIEVAVVESEQVLAVVGTTAAASDPAVQSCENSDGSANSPESPAIEGSEMSCVLNGAGMLTPVPEDGAILEEGASVGVLPVHYLPLSLNTEVKAVSVAGPAGPVRVRFTAPPGYGPGTELARGHPIQFRVGSRLTSDYTVTTISR